jgi:hypothetical protein
VSTWSFLSVVHPLRILIPMCVKNIRVQQENLYKITYCLRVFSWEEKLVASLIGAPNVDRAIEDKMIGKKAMIQITRVIHACRKESLFFFANKLDKVLVQITLVVLSGFKIMGEIEMAGAMFLLIFVLKTPSSQG